MKPIRILHIVSTMDYGGVETLLMSIYRILDRNKIQFDFLCHNRIEAAFTEEILSMGGRMFMVHGPRHGGIFNYLKELKTFFRSHPEYSVIHAHMNRDNAFSLIQAKRAGIPIRISHSHVAGKKASWLYHIYDTAAKLICRKTMTHGFACSKDAGLDQFGKHIPFVIITNGIDVNRFIFNESERIFCRTELGVPDACCLIGHVGRFDASKNHIFLIQVFEELYRKYPDIRLLLIGDGDNIGRIREMVQVKGLENGVFFAGQHRELEQYYSAMDVFVFPSLFEGFGIAAVEAQSCGLPVVASDTVPKEANITGRMRFLSLDAPIATWAEQILQEAVASTCDRSQYSKIVLNSNYNIQKTADFLTDFYLKNWIDRTKCGK